MSERFAASRRGLAALGCALLAGPAMRFGLRLWGRLFGDEQDPVAVLHAERSAMLEQWWLLGFLIAGTSVFLLGLFRRETLERRGVPAAFLLGVLGLLCELAAFR